MNLEQKARIVLVVSDPPLSAAYLKHLDSYQAEVKTVGSIKELERELSREGYNGIIIDLKTKLAAPRDQKELAYELLEHYPVLQSRIIPDSGKFQAMPFGKAKGEVSLDQFMTQVCPEFGARMVRSSPRKSLHFNVLLSRNGNFSGADVERACTLNVSKGGCFIVSTLNWLIGNSVAFIFKELTHTTPMVGEIRWHTPWGKAMAMPGIGIKFEDMEAGQARELVDKFRL